MGKKYHQGKYKRGKFQRSRKARLADLSKQGTYAKTFQQWKQDPRKYDYPGIDDLQTARRTKPFKYTARSKLKKSKPGSQNKKHRKYWYPKRSRRR
jgi:hypothetical protein